MNLSPSLYIIGNGFDLRHKIPSDCKDFASYLKAVDGNTYREIESYFGVADDFWGAFEKQLANFDVDAAIDYASQFLMSYGDEYWSDSGHHDYQYELERIVEAISTTMRTRFAEWIRQIPIPTAAGLSVKPLQLDPNARYLSFNYTQTLQQTYGISNSQILHIHGSASDPTDQLILGHGWQRSSVDSLNHGIDPEEDTRVIEGNQIVDNYFSQTFKPTDRIIKHKQPFFGSLNLIRHIFLMGHSLSEIDSPYFREIVRNIDVSSVIWKISYKDADEDDQEKMQINFSKLELGIDMSLVSFLPLNNVHQWKA